MSFLFLQRYLTLPFPPMFASSSTIPFADHDPQAPSRGGDRRVRVGVLVEIIIHFLRQKHQVGPVPVLEIMPLQGCKDMEPISLGVGTSGSRSVDCT